MLGDQCLKDMSIAKYMFVVFVLFLLNWISNFISFFFIIVLFKIDDLKFKASS